MKKGFKFLLVLVALLLGVLFFAPMLFRGEIETLVKREANRMLQAQLDFEKLDISLLRHFPNASVELDYLTLVGVERFAGDTILSAKQIAVVVNPLSLLGDEGFEVKKILLATPSLHAHKLADGAVNWDVMRPAEEELAGVEEEQPAEGEGASSFRFAVRDFRIEKASLRYEDDSTNMQVRIAPLSLRLRGDLSAAQSDLDLRLRCGEVDVVQGGIPLLSHAEVELNAAIAADLERKHFALSRNTLRLNAIELSLDGWAELREEALALDMKAACERVQFKELLSLIPAFYTREFRNLNASGELSLSLWAKGEMRENLLPAFELKSEVKEGSFQYSSLPKAVTDINIVARVANPGGVMDRTVVEIPTFGLKMAGNALSATLHATNLMSDPKVSASASGHLDLGAIHEVYPLEKGTSLDGDVTADISLSARKSDIEERRFAQMKASGTFVVEQLGLNLADLPPLYIRRAAATITPQTMTLGELGVTLGGSDVEAKGQLSNYLGYLLSGNELSGRLYVKSNLLDLNELMQNKTTDTESGKPAAEEASSEPLSAIEVPKNLNLSLDATVGKILFQKMVIEQLVGEVRLAKGALSLDRLTMNLFGGKASASGAYSTATNPAKPQVNLDLSLSKGSFARTFEEVEVVQKLVPIFATTGGDYTLALNLKTALDGQMSPDLNSLTASGLIQSENIKVQNIKAFDLLATTLKNEKLRQIEARDVKIRFSIKEGKVATSPFDIRLGDAKVTLSGTTSLTQQIDYVAKVALPKSATKGVVENVDVKITGSFSAPKISLDVKQVAEQALTNVVNEQLEKLTGSKSVAEEVEKQVAKLREEAQRGGEKLIKVAEEQRQKLIDAATPKGKLAEFAATKAGDKLVEEARKQSEKLVAEAEAQIAKLTTPSSAE